MKTITTTTRDIFTPSYDRTIDQTYTGNHLGYWVTFFRKGDTLTVNHYGEKGWNPVRPLLATETHSISGVVAGLVDDSFELGIDYQVDDNIPEGFSLPA